MLVAQANNILSKNLPTLAVFALAAVALGAWVAAYLVLPRLRGPAWTNRLRPVVRVAMGIVAMMLIFAAATRTVLLSTTWPLWILALMGATCIESLVALYAFERHTVHRKGGTVALGLRIVLAMGLIVMLAQPVWSWDLFRDKPKTVAILLDSSASMHMDQKYLTPADKVRLGEAMGVLERPYALDTLRSELDVIRRDAIETRDWLNTLKAAASETRGRQIVTRRAAMRKQFDEGVKTIEARMKGLWGKQMSTFAPAQRAARDSLDATLSGEVVDALKSAGKVLDQTNAEKLAEAYPALLDRTNGVLAILASVQQSAGPLADALDAAYHAQLPEKTRQKLDVMAARTRYQLARDVLQRQRGGADSFIEQIGADFAVDLHAFDSTVRQVTLEDGFTQGELTAEQQQTALAGALEKVLASADVSRLVGVVVLSDMRHNGPGRPRDIASRFGWKSIPVCPVVFGSSQPPPDAAVASVSAPETLYPEDKLLVSAKIKLDGLAGRDVVVTLNDGDREVGRQTIRVPDVASLRREVQFSCTPESLGDHTYRVRVEPVEGEAVADNNETPFSVKVHDDRTKMLLIDSRPRWEMRYLKNLFTNRDASVNLQYVLLYPDRTASEPKAKTVHASASRPRGQAEANALPETKDEWLKFDVVILGDVSPVDLGDEAVEALDELVTTRGGTLVCIAGQRHMPHAFGATPLKDLLPVTFEPGPDAPEMPERAFRIDMTSEGARNVIMRLEVDPAENRRVWDELPDIYWRHPLTGVKDGATVLAYARGADVPGPLRSTMDADARKIRLAEIRDYQRSRALVTLHNYGRGRVMFMGFDRTWRLRYRQGDTYHHRLWGQVLRWATADRLSSGTAQVKVGTDRVRYTIDDRVRVRAQIYLEDNTGLTKGDVAVEIYREKPNPADPEAPRLRELVMRRSLVPVPNAPGAYSGDLGKMAMGAYQVVLAGRAVKDVLVQEGAAETVEASFTVGAATSGEQVELAADRVLAGQIAGVSGGVSVDPAQIDQVLKALGVGEQSAKANLAQWDLWDSWPLLAIMLAVLTGEWLLRKRIGLT